MTATSEKYDVKVELDSGVSLTTGKPWAGHRVKYRRVGARRWASFLLSKEDGTLPTQVEILRAIKAHEAL